MAKVVLETKWFQLFHGFLQSATAKEPNPHKDTDQANEYNI